MRGYGSDLFSLLCALLSCGLLPAVAWCTLWFSHRHRYPEALRELTMGVCLMILPLGVALLGARPLLMFISFPANLVVFGLLIRVLWLARAAGSTVPVIISWGFPGVVFLNLLLPFFLFWCMAVAGLLPLQESAPGIPGQMVDVEGEQHCIVELPPAYPQDGVYLRVHYQQPLPSSVRPLRLAGSWARILVPEEFRVPRSDPNPPLAPPMDFDFRCRPEHRGPGHLCTAFLFRPGVSGVRADTFTIAGAADPRAQLQSCEVVIVRSVLGLYLYNGSRGPMAIESEPPPILQ